MATKRIKLIKAWAMSGAGEVVEYDAPIADLLIQRGRGVAVAPVQARVPKTPALVRKLKRSKRGKR